MTTSHQARKKEWDLLKAQDKLLYETVRDGKRIYNDWRRNPFNQDGTPKMQQGGFAPQPLKIKVNGKEMIVPYIKRTKYTKL